MRRGLVSDARRTRSTSWGPIREYSGMKWARCSTFTESTCRTPVRLTVRPRVRIVGGEWGGSRKPCAASAIRRAWARDSVAVEPARVGEGTDANLAAVADSPSVTGPRMVMRVVLEDDFGPRLAIRLARMGDQR